MSKNDLTNLGLTCLTSVVIGGMFYIFRNEIIELVAMSITGDKTPDDRDYYYTKVRGHFRIGQYGVEYVKPHYRKTTKKKR